MKIGMLPGPPGLPQRQRQQTNEHRHMSRKAGQCPAAPQARHVSHRKLRLIITRSKRCTSVADVERQGNALQHPVRRMVASGQVRLKNEPRAVRPSSRLLPGAHLLTVPKIMSCTVHCTTPERLSGPAAQPTLRMQGARTTNPTCGLFLKVHRCQLAEQTCCNGQEGITTRHVHVRSQPHL